MTRLITLLTITLCLSLGAPGIASAHPAPCLERSWIPLGGMPTAEADWRVVRLADCAVRRWWPGHTRLVLTIVDRESGYFPYATNPDDGVACWAGTYGSCGLGQHLIRYWPGRASAYLRRDWFKVWPVPWWNARANMIVTVRMMAAQGSVCPAWC